jgi:hypothetical protein
MEPFNTLLQIPQLPFWLLRQVLKWFGISPEPLVSFSAPYDYAAEPHVVFPHVSVVLHRQRWLGEIRRIENCGVRLRVWRVNTREEDGLVAQGVWAPNLPAENVEHLTLFEGPFTSFRIPMVVYSMTPDYRKLDLTPGAYLANESFLHPHKPAVIRIGPGEYFLAIDLVKGNAIRTTSRLLLSVSEDANWIAMERLLSEPGGQWARSVFRARIEEGTEPGVVVHRSI